MYLKKDNMRVLLECGKLAQAKLLGETELSTYILSELNR